MIDRGEEVDRAALGQEALDWINHISSGEATAEDTAAMMRWRSASPAHAEALRDAARLRRRVAAAGGRLRTEPQARWLFAPATGRASPLLDRRRVIGAVIAASAGGLLLVRPPLGLWPSLDEWDADYRTGIGERRPVEIARGLTLELNTQTSVSRRDDPMAYRLALIAGEVAVDARRSERPVVIEAGHGEARAGRAGFGVRLADAAMCVTCTDGEVEVAERRGAARVTLRSGQQVTLGARGLGGIVPVDVQRVQSWVSGRLIFDNRPLRDVIEEINRYRPGRIILANRALADIPVNAVFRLDRIDDAVAQIREVSNASVMALPAGVVVLS